MIMGDICTRSCRFCSVSSGRPDALDVAEPKRVADAVKRLSLQHVVITSVNRDDLDDEGAMHFVQVIEEVKKVSSEIIIEILTPDFKRTQGSAVAMILAAEPHIFNHNVETIPRLYTRVRPQADYVKSLQIFREMKARSERILAKSGLMLGMGETEPEVLQVLRDLRTAGCDILTLGQYLQSSKMGVPVEEYVHPDKFLMYKNEAFKMGFGWVESGPFVRSSYHAKGTFESLKKAIQEKQLAGAK
jgi:lipoic acid synthetase